MPSGWNITKLDYLEPMEKTTKAKAETCSMRMTLERHSVLFRQISKEVLRNVKKLSKKLDVDGGETEVLPTAWQEDLYKISIYCCREAAVYTMAREINSRIVHHLKQEIKKMGQSLWCCLNLTYPKPMLLQQETPVHL